MGRCLQPVPRMRSISSVWRAVKQEAELILNIRMVEGPGCRLNGEKLRSKVKTGQKVRQVAGSLTVSKVWSQLLLNINVVTSLIQCVSVERRSQDKQCVWQFSRLSVHRAGHSWQGALHVLWLKGFEVNGTDPCFSQHLNAGTHSVQTKPAHFLQQV